MKRKVVFTENKKDIIYVGNLPKQLTEDQLRKYFNQFGDVVNIKLVKSAKTNRPKGYAFVQFEDHEIAKIAAEAMDKYLIDGRSLKVHVKEDEEIVKHLFKRGKTIMLKKNKIKLMNNTLDSNRRSLDEKMKEVLEAVKNGEKLEMDAKTKVLMRKLKKNLDKLKDKQKRFDTDLYDDEIKTYTNAYDTLKKHFQSKK